MEDRNDIAIYNTKILRIKNKMSAPSAESGVLGKKYNHPIYGEVRVAAIKPKGSNFGKNKKDRVLIKKTFDSTESGRWVDEHSFLEKAIEAPNVVIPKFASAESGVLATAALMPVIVWTTRACWSGFCPSP